MTRPPADARPFDAADRAAGDAGGAPPDLDLDLKQRLQALPPSVDAERLAALQQRVLDHWQATVGAAAAEVRTAPVAQGVRWLTLIGAAPRRRWALAGGLALGLTVAVGAWMHRPDPVMEELLHPDVLSQMAAGEM
jgi:hypothetical protein